MSISLLLIRSMSIKEARSFEIVPGIFKLLKRAHLSARSSPTIPIILAINQCILRWSRDRI